MRGHALAGEQRHAERAHDAVVRRHDDVLVEDLAERRGDGVVVGRAALEEDHVADVALAHQAVEVVGRDAEGEAGDEVVAAGAALLVRHDVALHEHRAALAEPDRRLGAERQLGELADDVDAQLLRLLLEERAGAGGAGLVHGEVDDDAVLQADELAVLAADLEDRVALLADLAADEVGARLVGGDLVGDDVGPGELADELASGARGAHAEQVDAGADLALDVGEALAHDLDRARVGLGVDLLDDVALVVDDDEVRRDRADVDAHVRVDDRPVAVELVRLGHVAEQHDAVHREALGERELRRRQALDVEPEDGGVARRLEVGLDERGADGADARVVLGDEQLAVVEGEGLAQRAHGALVGGHAADERDGRLDDLALGDGALEVAHHRVAEAAQHLGRLVALLLRVDHVALGEDAAAPGDAGGLAGAEHDVAHVLDVVEQPARLLVHERAGAGGAVAVGLVVGDAGAADVARLQTDELGGLAAHLEDRLRLGMQRGDAARDGLELVLEGGVERRSDEAPAGAGDAGAVHGALGQHRQQLAEQGLGRLGRAALDAPVLRHEHRRAVDDRQTVAGRLEEVGVLREKVTEEVLVISPADECGLEADAADVDAKRGHGCDTGSSSGGRTAPPTAKPTVRARPEQTGRKEDYMSPLSSSTRRRRRTPGAPANVTPHGPAASPVRRAS